MPRPANPLPNPLARAADRFARRRAIRTHRRLTPCLWEQATILARRFGVSKTAQALGLNYTRLRQRAQTPASAGPRPPRQSKPRFVEVLHANPLAHPEGVLELERPDGARARIHLPGGRFDDWAALARSLWEAPTCSK